MYLFLKFERLSTNEKNRISITIYLFCRTNVMLEFTNIYEFCLYTIIGVFFIKKQVRSFSL